MESNNRVLLEQPEVICRPSQRASQQNILANIRNMKKATQLHKSSPLQRASLAGTSPLRANNFLKEDLHVSQSRNFHEPIVSFAGPIDPRDAHHRMSDSPLKPISYERIEFEPIEQVIHVRDPERQRSPLQPRVVTHQ